MANAMIPALAGTDILSGVGNLDSGLAGCLEAAVIDDEMIGLIKHIVRGYEVTPETLAFDVMQEVIPAGGMFLADMHTVREMRKGAIWVPTLGDAAADPSQANVVARARHPGQLRFCANTKWRRCRTMSCATWMRSSRRLAARRKPSRREGGVPLHHCLTRESVAHQPDLPVPNTLVHPRRRIIMAKRISRRRFLKYAGVSSAGAVLALAGCAPPPAAPPPAAAPTSAPAAPAATAVPAATVAPAPTAAPAAAAEPKILRIRLYGDMQNIDPAFRISNNDETIIDAVFSKLVTYGPGSYELKNDLAEKIEQSEDGKTITFKLREGVMWPKGYGELTAEDVKYSYERIADPALKAAYADDWAALDHVEVIDKYNGKIILKEPFAALWKTTLPIGSGDDRQQEVGRGGRRREVRDGRHRHRSVLHRRLAAEAADHPQAQSRLLRRTPGLR